MTVIGGRPLNHGTTWCYQKGCRCESCRAAKNAYRRAWRAKCKARRAGAIFKHGVTGYNTWGCRCETCVVAYSKFMAPHRKAWRARNLRKSAEYLQRLRSGAYPRDRVKEKEWHAKVQQTTLERATRYGQQWTGPELEIAARQDLTVQQIAFMIGRTYWAVVTMRHNLEVEPKYIALAGLSQAESVAS